MTNKAAAELARLRVKTMRLCDGCGKTVPMLQVQRACSSTCRTRLHRRLRKEKLSPSAG